MSLRVKSVAELPKHIRARVLAALPSPNLSSPAAATGKGKIKSRKIDLDGHRFDSMAEVDRYRVLMTQQRSGLISNVHVHPRFPLVIGAGTDNERPILIRSKGFPQGRAAVYTADFSWDDIDGTPNVDEVKGFDTEAARLRRAVFEAIYGIKVNVISAHGRGGYRSSRNGRRSLTKH